MTIFFENKEIVVPGELLAEGDYLLGNNVYRIEKNIHSNILGSVDYHNKKLQVVALEGFYYPTVDDKVIGIIIGVNLNGWTVDINSPYKANLKASEALRKPFKPWRDDLKQYLIEGDIILAQIIDFNRNQDPNLTIKSRELGKISKGQIIKVTPAKIPRIIGRKGSMINMLKTQTKCKITIGRNGFVLISSEKEENKKIAINAIKTIVKEAHISGLTDKISTLLKK